MKHNLIGVEVGVMLNVDHPSYLDYKIGEHSLYDENVCTYIEEDEDKARAYALDYVEKGVENTYAIIFHMGSCNLLEGELEEIKSNGYYEETSIDVSTIISSYVKVNGSVLEGLD